MVSPVCVCCCCGASLISCSLHAAYCRHNKHICIGLGAHYLLEIDRTTCTVLGGVLFCFLFERKVLSRGHQRARGGLGFFF